MLNRRHFLRGLGGAALALPFLETFQSKQAKAEDGGYPPYAIWLRQANGVQQATSGEPDRYWPEQTGTLTQSGLAAQSRALSVMSDYADKLIALKGINFAFPGNGCGHSGGGNQCLTAARVSQTPSGNESLSEGESIDNFIATALHEPGVEPLTLYAGKMSGYINEVLSYRGPQQLRPAERNPFNAYMDLFGLNNLEQEELERLKAARMSVNDLVRSEMQTLMGRKDLSQADRDRLAMHFDAIRDLEIGMSCELSEMEIAEMEAIQGQLGNSDNLITIAKMQCDIIALAVACGAVRSATLQIGDGNDSTQYTINGQKQYSYHWISHRIQGDGSEGTAIQGADVLHHEIDKIHLDIFKHLCDRLSSYSLGNGTLLDSGVSVLLNDLANRYHSYQDVPYILVGSANDYLKTGQFLDVGGVNNNKLFNTIATAMGITKQNGGPIDDFGDSSLEGGLIGQIIA
ncbi:MAG: DUF1552 domain-containing protein [Polyangiaceae bacterium]